MPSILGSTYPVSALVPSILPAAAFGSDSRQAEQKPNPLSVAEPSRVLSNRVTAFLTSDQTARARGSRQDGEGVDSQGPHEPAARETDPNAGAGKATSLVETSETDSQHETENSGPQPGTVSVHFDDAKIYRPSSIY